MTAHVLLIMRRPKRRTHLNGAHGPLCGTVTTLTGAQFTPLELVGGATARFKNDLIREMDGNSCVHCTRIGLGMLALYASRDTGKAW